MMWARCSIFGLAAAFAPDAAIAAQARGTSLQPFEEEQSGADATSLLQLAFEGVHPNKSRAAGLHKVAPDTPQNADARFRLSDARSRSGSTSTLAASDSLCIEGKLVPQLWVLGAPKCGTTSLADDLREAGVPSDAEPTKELHFFDNWAHGRSLCDAAEYSEMRSAWLDLFPPCPTGGGFQIIGEYTPDNMRLSPAPPRWRISAIGDMVPSSTQPIPWDSVDEEKACVPSILHSHMYSGLTSRLTFVTMVRDPISRVLSAYYFRREFISGETVLPGEFQTDMELKVKAMQLNIYDTYIWPTMYARHIENYLAYFDASQFIVAAMHHYFDHKCLMFREVSTRIGIDLPCTVGEPAAYENEGSHPALEEVLDNSTRDSFELSMKPEVERLVTLLTHYSLSGMSLVAYNGTLGSEEEVEDWLLDGW